MKRDQNWDSMKPTAFSYSFTPKQFYYFLFKKPKCPRCGEKLIRRKEAMANVDDTKVKYYYYTYTCPRCQAKYTLDELTR